ncbi:hypothetical protein [Wansuia hejianensis]|uniref:Uncharacterized protein n=1 Tax=Wansuia hejianensis TaxID=2763667 RepID=A0A7G9G8R6_9FIRM|nr:hypothetical protein [Wansuia hejianensis]QNM07198.1 hypothetical protein H9Q79_09510 [Wansuia hejianensis]RHV91235.1 hypothetical protein DXA96_03455 [Lachnospiraceae bacterium OF09-33XD]
MNEIVNIQLLNMEIGVKEQLVELPDGNYTLFLNSRYSTDTNYESYLHAYNKHVLGNDFEKSNVQQIEAVAHVDNNPPAPKAEKRSTPAAMMSRNIFEKRIQAIKRRQRRIRKELARVERDMKKLERYGVDFFARAEEEHLYGGL